MTSPFVSFQTCLAYYDEDTALVCPTCMRDAQAGGLRMMATRVPVGRFPCDYCKRWIGR